MKAHPDRRATTLAQREQLRASDCADELAAATVRGDARVDLQLLRFAAEQALASRGTAAARARIAGLDSPDLLAGTVQDGTARGLMARLEEAISLCEPEPEERRGDAADDSAVPLDGKALRRTREFLVASGGTRVRFSRRHGVLVVDRRRGLELHDCIQFEDRTDQGDLDAFGGVPGERPRLFSPAFLRPLEAVQGGDEDRLVLGGSLGRGPRGYPCRITIVGRKAEPGLRLTVRIDNRHPDHRLRIRFRGVCDAQFVAAHGTPGVEFVHNAGRTFLTATLLRACGRLRVGDAVVSTPDAQLLKVVEHRFDLGMADDG